MEKVTIGWNLNPKLSDGSDLSSPYFIKFKTPELNEPKSRCEPGTMVTPVI
jgi:hypothetical protein